MVTGAAACVCSQNPEPSLTLTVTQHSNMSFRSHTHTFVEVHHNHTHKRQTGKGGRKRQCTVSAHMLHSLHSCPDRGRAHVPLTTTWHHPPTHPTLPHPCVPVGHTGMQHKQNAGAQALTQPAAPAASAAATPGLPAYSHTPKLDG